ncbi:DUF4190 domain-containing protein [Actinomycetospora flava]|uniref:DUF4190 domain-containing protein n=1 Tax=Actinomycetospora flava TaxID=3129232 RepID=A0ABU8M9M7_9PSEU
MSQQPPYPHDDAPTVTLRPSATHGPPPPLQNRPTGTNTMAILAIVFAFVFSPLGIVFGVVGRNQTRRTGQAGRGLAATGLVLSIVFLVAAVAATLYVTVLAAQFVGSVPTDQPGVSEPADLPAEEPVAPTGPVPTGPAGTAQVGIADGDYGPEVPSEALAEQVGAQSGATDVICPGYLPAQVEASTICAGAVDGQQAQLEARVTAVEGSEATVDIARVG